MTTNTKSARPQAKKTKTKAKGSSARSRSKRKTAPARNQVPCVACGLCCTYVAFDVDEPSTPKRATEILWHLYHPGVAVYRDGDEWLVQFETKCQHQADDNKCKIYRRRPHICREHAEAWCEVNAEHEGMYFGTPGEFLDYLQRRRKKVYAAIKKDFMPPAGTLDRKASPRRRLPAFKTRFRRLRAMGAP